MQTTSIETASDFRRELDVLATNEQREKYRRFFPGDESFIGVRMGDVFALAKRAIDLPVGEIESLLESPVHEVRAGACSVMGKSATARATSDERRRELFELYLRRHDRVDAWDLVDLAAHQVVGTWLLDKPRDELYRLARSDFWPERRTAIVATAAFLRRRQTDDTFRIAIELIDDKVELVQKGVGWMLRVAGDVDPATQLEFLEQHAARMPRTMLRYAGEKLDKPTRDRLRAL